MARAEAVAFLQERVATFAASSLGRSRFAPAADVWLNKGRYDDDPEAWLRGDDDPKPPGPAPRETAMFPSLSELEL